METKICSDCGLELELNTTNFQPVRDRKKGTQYWRKYCRECEKIRRKIKYVPYKDKPKHQKQVIKACLRRYAKSEKGRKAKDKWAKANPEKIKAALARGMNRQIQNLGNTYMKILITQDTPLSFSDVPQELVELKRKQIKLYRDVKNKNNNS